MRNLNLPGLIRNVFGSLFASKADLIRGKRISKYRTRTGHSGSKSSQGKQVARRRKHRAMTKRIQRVRRRRGRNQRTG